MDNSERVCLLRVGDVFRMHHSEQWKIVSSFKNGRLWYRYVHEVAKQEVGHVGMFSKQIVHIGDLKAIMDERKSIKGHAKEAI